MTQNRVQAYNLSSSYPAKKSSFHSNDSSKEAAFEMITNLMSIVLYGPPGTGKTRMVSDLVQSLEERKTLGKTEFVQFHPKFSYEDFIEGYKPDGKGNFEIRNGIFKEFCENVKDDTESIHLFIIDEFNRTELSTTLGEVLYLIEDREKREARTAHSQELFRIPENVVIVATMNTADKNIALIDYALRRRFAFIPVWPDYYVMREWLNKIGLQVEGLTVEEYCKAAFTLNQRIINHPLMNKHMQLGHSMFVSGKRENMRLSDIADVFRYSIFPQLETYCGFGREDELQRLLSQEISEKIIKSSIISDADVFALIKALANDSIAEAVFE